MKDLDITDFIEEQKKLKVREQRLRDFELFAVRLLAVIVLVWALLYFFVGFTAMNGNGMYPRIDGGDLLLFYRLDREPVAQDVIVFEHEGERFVGRVTAIPGDTVEVTEDNALIINGSVQIESNIFYPTPLYDSDVVFPLTLGQDEYFVLSDNRTEGMDSRWFGPVSQKDIEGTVISILRRNHL